MYHYTVTNKTTGEIILSSKNRQGFAGYLGKDQAWAAATNSMIDNRMDEARHTILVENTYKETTGPTPEQEQKMQELRKKGYTWDVDHSIAAAGVVLKNLEGDFWLFGMEGEIMHNPEGLVIKL